MSAPASLGQLLLDLRTARGWTLRDLAGATGLSASVLSGVERGQQIPSLAVVRAVAPLLGVAASDLDRLPRTGRRAYGAYGRFPAAVRRARAAHGWTQTALAAHVGVCQVTVSQWEAGTRVPSVRGLTRLATIFGVTPFMLLAGEVAT